MDKIAVLIPCYNEAVTIKKVVKDWQSALPEAVIYVYDNNSTDRTDEIARAAGAVVRYEGRQGKGNVIRRMFREIDADCYVMVDGDDTYPAEAGPEMVRDVLEGGADMVVGDRLSSTYFTENKRPFHNFGNSFTRGVINRMFDSDIKDIMTGLRAFSYEFVKTYPVLSKGFEIETEMTIHALDRNMAIKNVVIEYRDRPEGSSSKLNTVSDGLRVIKTMFALYKNYKPAQFFWPDRPYSRRCRNMHVYSCPSGICRDKACRQIPDTDCERLHDPRRDYFIFHGAHAADDDPEGPHGIRVPTPDGKRYAPSEKKKSAY